MAEEKKIVDVNSLIDTSKPAGTTVDVSSLIKTDDIKKNESSPSESLEEGTNSGVIAESPIPQPAPPPQDIRTTKIGGDAVAYLKANVLPPLPKTNKETGQVETKESGGVTIMPEEPTIEGYDTRDKPIFTAHRVAKNGDIVGANKILKSAVKFADPERDVYPFVLKAYTEEQIGNLAEAEKDYNVAISYAPERIDLLPMRGAVRLSTGNVDGAKSDFATYLNKTGAVSNGSIDKANALATTYKGLAVLAESGGNQEKIDEYTQKAEYWKKNGEFIQQAKIQQYKAETLKGISDYILTSPYGAGGVLFSPFQAMGAGIEKIGTGLSGDRQRYVDAGGGALERVDERLSPTERVVTTLAGMMETGMGIGNLVPVGMGLPSAIATTKAPKAVNTALGFLAPELMNFNLAMKGAELVAPHELTKAVTAPVTTALERAGVDMSKLSTLQEEGVALGDMIGFITLLHTAKGITTMKASADKARAGEYVDEKAEGAMAVADAAEASERYANEVIGRPAVSMENISRLRSNMSGIYDKMATNQPLTRQEATEVLKAVAETTPQEVETAVNLMTQQVESKKTAEELNKFQDEEPTTTYRVGDKLFETREEYDAEIERQKSLGVENIDARIGGKKEESPTNTTFPNSVVPKVVYHGTKAKFTDFDESKIGTNDYGVYGRGIYLTESKFDAANYGGGTYDNVMPFEVNIERPYEFDVLDGESVSAARKLLSGKEIPPEYDGVIGYENGVMREIVVRDKSQIKLKTDIESETTKEPASDAVPIKDNQDAASQAEENIETKDATSDKPSGEHLGGNIKDIPSREQFLESYIQDAIEYEVSRGNYNDFNHQRLNKIKKENLSELRKNGQLEHTLEYAYTERYIKSKEGTQESKEQTESAEPPKAEEVPVIEQQPPVEEVLKTPSRKEATAVEQPAQPTARRAEDIDIDEFISGLSDKTIEKHQLYDYMSPEHKAREIASIITEEQMPGVRDRINTLVSESHGILPYGVKKSSLSPEQSAKLSSNIEELSRLRDEYNAKHKENFDILKSNAEKKLATAEPVKEVAPEGPEYEGEVTPPHTEADIPPLAEPVAPKKVAPKSFKASNGLTIKVIDGEAKAFDKNGKEIKKVTGTSPKGHPIYNKRYRAAMKEYVDGVDLEAGEVADMRGIEADRVTDRILESSTNPAEVLNQYFVEMELHESSKSPEEVAISKHVGRRGVTYNSVKEHWDSADDLKVVNKYIGSTGRPLDKIAQEASGEFGAEETDRITPADVLKFMKKYPAGIESFNVRGSNARALADKFETLTGIRLDATTEGALREKLAKTKSSGDWGDVAVDGVTKEMVDALEEGPITIETLPIFRDAFTPEEYKIVEEALKNETYTEESAVQGARGGEPALRPTDMGETTERVEVKAEEPVRTEEPVKEEVVTDAESTREGAETPSEKETPVGEEGEGLRVRNAEKDRMETEGEGKAEEPVAEPKAEEPPAEPPVEPPAEPKAEEPSEGRPGPSGIKKALVPESVIEQLDIQSQRVEDIIKAGRDAVESGKIDPAESINEIAVGAGRPLSAVEIAAFVHYKVGLDAQRFAELKARDAAIANGDYGAEVKANARLIEIDRKLEQYNIMSAKTAYEQGLAFNLRQVLLNSEYNLEKEILDYKRSNNDYIEPEVEAKFREYDAQIKELNEKLKEYEERMIDENDQTTIFALKKKPPKETKRAVSDRLNKIADFVEKGKIEDDIMMGSIPFVKEAWNLGIDATAKTLRTAGKVADAIDAGIKAIKGTEWYKGLDADGKKRAEERFSNHVNDLVSSAEKEIEPVVDGKIKIPVKMLREIVGGGVEDVPTLIAEVRKRTGDALNDFSDRQIRDAITKYGEIITMSGEEVNVKLRELKRIGKYISQLEDIWNKQRPKRSGLQRDDLTPREREYQKLIREEMKKLPQTQEDVDKHFKTALEGIKTRLRNQIEDLDRQKNTGYRPGPKTKVEYDAEAKDLVKKRDELKEELNRLDGKEKLTDEQRVKRAMGAAERALAETERRIAQKDFERKRSKTPETPELKALRERLKVEKEVLEQLKEETGYANKKANEVYRGVLDRQIKEYEDRIKNKDYEPKKRKGLDLEQETKVLQAKRDMIREKFEEEKEKAKIRNGNIYNRTWNEILSIANLPRTMMASLDYSAPLRQALVLTVANPRTAVRTFRQTLPTLFDKTKYEDFYANLRAHPLYKLMKDSGLYIAEPNAKMSAREELFMSDLPKRIPGVKQTYGKLVEASERAYVGYLNRMRVAEFLQLAEGLRKDGKTFETHPEEFKYAAKWANNATGRGSLGMLEEAGPALNAFFFSPRLIASRFNMLNPTTYVKMPKSVRWRALREVGQTLATGLTLLYMAKAAGAEVEDDMRSADFGKIKIGNTRFDIWGGYQQWAVLAARLMSGETKSTTTGTIRKLSKDEYPGDTEWDVLERFLYSKMAPVPAIIKRAVDEQNMVGEEFDLQEEAVNAAIPLYVQDIRDIYKEAGLGTASAAAMASFFGVGVQNYGGPKTFSKRKVEKIMEKRVEKKMEKNTPEERRKAEQLERAGKLRERELMEKAREYGIPYRKK